MSTRGEWIARKTGESQLPVRWVIFAACWALFFFGLGTLLGTYRGAEAERLRAKAAWYEASAAYSFCRKDHCGGDSCGPEPIWRNGE